MRLIVNDQMARIKIAVDKGVVTRHKIHRRLLDDRRKRIDLSEQFVIGGVLKPLARLSHPPRHVESTERISRRTVGTGEVWINAMQRLQEFGKRCSQSNALRDAEIRAARRCAADHSVTSERPGKLFCWLSDEKHG